MALNIIKGIQKKPIKAVIYGPPGVGKTTLGAGLPKPLFIDAEDGTAQLDVARVPVSTAAGLRSTIAEIRKDRQGFETLVIDTGDWVETLITEETLAAQKVKNIEDVGYGKGWTYLREAWSRFLADLDAIATTGMHVVILAHSVTQKIALPGQPAAYDTFSLKLDPKNSERLKEWASMILFLNYDVQVQKGKDGRMRGVGGDERVLFTSPSAAWIAKNRFGLDPVLTAEAAHLLPIFTGKVTTPATTPTPPPATPEPPPPPSPITADQLYALRKYAADYTPLRDLISKALEHYKETALDLLTTKQAETILDRCEEEKAKLAPPASKPAAPAYPWGNLLRWLEANEAAVNTFLVSVKWIEAGKTFRDLPPDRCDKIKDAPARFARGASIDPATIPAA
ncbi:ATP-binding protein [Geminisphaera colitermitum]|uniref:ATP-binding protein n=1 Tax=Geminisphaera colitermitum TaxID=1148786 RepID=UPI0001964E5C|nr:ATP-binding protein [Geminisphaera colitermitum]